MLKKQTNKNTHRKKPKINKKTPTTDKMKLNEFSDDILRLKGRCK